MLNEVLAFETFLYITTYLCEVSGVDFEVKQLSLFSYRGFVTIKRLGGTNTLHFNETCN